MADPDYDNTNKGRLFRNYDKKKLSNERDTSSWPNAQGKINIYGVDFYLNSWTKTIKSGDNKGDKMQSLAIKPVDEEEGKKLKKLIESHINNNSPTSKKEKENIDMDEDDDDIPF